MEKGKDTTERHRTGEDRTREQKKEENPSTPIYPSPPNAHRHVRGPTTAK